MWATDALLPLLLTAHFCRPRVGIVHSAVEGLGPEPGRVRWLDPGMRPCAARRPNPAPTIGVPAFQRLSRVAEGAYGFSRIQQPLIVTFHTTEVLAPQLEA